MSELAPARHTGGVTQEDAGSASFSRRGHAVRQLMPHRMIKPMGLKAESSWRRPVRVRAE